MIYLVSVFNIETNQYVPNSYRSWGYFFDKQQAIDAVLNNDADIFEMGYYNTAVVSGMREGLLMPSPSEEVFFKYGYSFATGEEVQQIEQPKAVRHMFFGFA